ncbi:MAG: NhaP-type Na+/H+ and K+/H+ antiporter [Pseudomonas sp.]|jgi:NhaP-type Na+/H+ and K+/H+ antiporter
MLTLIRLDTKVLVFVVLLFVIVWPLSVWLGMLGSGIAADQQRLIAWFGISGIGSVFYLVFAISHGLPSPVAEQLINITLIAVIASVLLHGISVSR